MFTKLYVQLLLYYCDTHVCYTNALLFSHLLDNIDEIKGCLSPTVGQTMIPLAHSKDAYRPLGSRLKEKVAGWIRIIFADRNSRNLLLFLILNLSFAFVELFYGIWTNR